MVLVLAGLSALVSVAAAAPSVTRVTFRNSQGREITSVSANDERRVTDLWIEIQLRDAKRDQLSTLIGSFSVADDDVMVPPPSGADAGAQSVPTCSDFGDGIPEDHKIFPKEQESDRRYHDRVRIVDAHFDDARDLLKIKVEVGISSCLVAAGQTRSLKFVGLNPNPASQATWFGMNQAKSIAILAASRK